MIADAGLLDPLAHGSRAIELTSDAVLLQALVHTELALSRALVDAGLAPDWMLAVCDAIADATTLDLVSIAAAGRSGGNPVIPLVKALGSAADAEHAGASDHLHVGATSQDILDTAQVLVARRVLTETITQLEDLGAVLASLAERHRATPMVGRTLGQHASPTAFGFVVAGWLDGVTTALVDLDRVRATLPLQYGGAVGTLAVLGEIAGDRADDVVSAFASRLELAVPTISWHSNRSAITGIGTAFAGAIAAAGRVALDVTVLARTEIAEVSESLGAGEGGSSAMPHKRNPVTAVLVASAARQAPAVLASLFASALSEDQRPSGAWHAEWLPLRALERLAVEATTGAASLATRLDVDIERMAANLDLTNGLVFSERVSAILSTPLGKRTAFDLVERASREAVETRRPLQVVVAGLLAEAGHSDELRATVWSAFGPADTGYSDAAIGRVVDSYRGLRRATVTEARE